MRTRLALAFTFLLAAAQVLPAAPAAADQEIAAVQVTPGAAVDSQSVGDSADDVVAAAAPRRRVQVGQVSIAALVRTDSLYPEPRVTAVPTSAPSLPPDVPHLPVEDRTARSVAPWMLAAGASLVATLMAALLRRPSSAP